MTKGMTRKCPGCGAKLEGITTDWVLSDRKIAGHAVATIGTAAHSARSDIRQAAEFQIVANLAAYELDYDFKLNLGFRGTAWVQCPEERQDVTFVCFPK